MRPEERPKDKTVMIRLGRAGRKSVRLDRPFEHTSGADEPPKPESGRLLELLRKAISASSSNRRGVTRHDVVDQEIWVGWWTNEKWSTR